MANQKTTELTADTAPVDADLVMTVDDVAGTPTNKKVTLANLAAGTPFSSRYQPLDSDLTAIAALSTTSFGRALLALADAAALRTAAGLGTAATSNTGDFDAAGSAAAAQAASQPVDSDLTAIAALTTTAYGRSLLEAANAAALRTLAGVVIGMDVQAYDADLAAIAALTSAADKVPYATGSGTWALADFTAAGRALVDDADASAQRTTLGLGNVDNTSDANKPVSTATQTALDLKANLASPALSGSPTAPTQTVNDNSTKIATTAYVDRRRIPGTFSNANATITTETYLAQVGTLSAARTVTLPAASSVPRGHEITVVDESGTATATNHIVIARAGSDTFVNPGNLKSTYNTSVFMKQPDAIRVRSDGTSKWFVVSPGTRRPYSWWMHPVDVAIPTGVWTPLPWNSPYNGAPGGDTAGADEFGVTPDLSSPNTTIAAGSNGVALPTATINVASTTGFASAGYLVITGPPSSGDDTIVSYTGTTASTFTGCNSAYRGGGVGISIGTLATDQVVRQANVEWSWPTGYLWNTIVDVAIDTLATTAYWGIRLRQIDNLFNFPIATNNYPGLNIANQHGQMALQPGSEGATGTPCRIEVFHNSASSFKLSKRDGIQAPSIMQAFMSNR